MITDPLRRDPLLHLPALIALALAATSLPARAEARLMVLCSGGQVPSPARQPGNDCDQACHASCSRSRKPGSSGRL